MSRGSIYTHRNQTYLQINNSINGLVPFVFIRNDAVAQRVIGCDPQEPLFFIRKTVKNGLIEDSFAYLGRESIWLIPESYVGNIFVSQQGELTSSMMDKIKHCAEKHEWIPANLLAYL